ncbi:CCA tRNA nucleotidyltransferase [Culicoidibacter larvae]|uniref:CCA tRNA nucleotidyltransferase n=1 Tax=Culicoidibacter larvae TaxID=2579976 RepID=A0A5R8QC68_9FIRM|nr:CCA tRNA nucleotidyltransferase [Culicoidibacter larvae]TLG74169.1 CCA tRNA nucleotidyltransferase [Culicoidibacter larvae]
MQLKIPESIQLVIDNFEANDFEIYLVGGCVRDLLLGTQPQDFDMTTNALPQDVVRLAEKFAWQATVTGEKYGTVTVIVADLAIEITTYRIDSKNGDGRRPEEVVFTADIVDDLARRDFTINACAYTPARGLVDPFGGQEDLAAGIIRTVGEPELRFNEDYLRMLRAVRFATRLHFIIEPVMLMAIKKLAPKVAVLSYERLRKELGEIIQAEHCLYGLKLLETTGLWQQIFPQTMITDIDLQRLPFFPKNEDWRWLALAWLLCPTASDIDIFLAPIALSENRKHWIKRMYNSLQQADVAMNVVALKRALAPLAINEREDFVQFMRLAIEPVAYFAEVEHIFSKREPLRIEELAIGGHDLLALGLQGAAIGETLNQLLDYVYQLPEKNTRASLIKFCQEELKV